MDARAVNAIMSAQHPDVAFDHIVWLVEALESWNSGRNKGKRVIVSLVDLQENVPGFEAGCFLRKEEEEE